MNSHPTRSIRLKRTVFPGLILAAAVFLLAACFSLSPAAGGATQAPAVDQTAPTSTRKVLAKTSTPPPILAPTIPAELQVNLADLRGMKVILWAPFVGELGGELQQLARDFSRENEWGIQAEVMLQSSDGALADLINQPEEDKLPQVVLAPSAQLNAWLQAGRLAALDPYLANPATQMEKTVLNGFAPVFWEQDQMDGRQAGIPALRSAYGLLYNKTWAGELGFSTPPATPAQFREQACEAAKENNRSQFLDYRGTGGWLVDTAPVVTLNWLTAFGLEAVPAQEGGGYQFAQEKGDSALAFLRKMQEDGCLWVGKNPTPLQYFAERYALFSSGSLQDLLPQARMMTGLENQDEWLLLGYPSSSGGPFVSTEGYSFGLLKSEADQQMAGWMFMRWLSLPANQARLGALYPSLPISSAWQEQAGDDRSNFPWTMILPLEKIRILPIPSLPSWLVARRPLEDAGWQLYNLASVEQLPSILPQLDALIKELLTP
jgi:multiple sugar transport system substrate-binding protein/sn-glycerol 3-phosphate transport system substrate-binding protein